MRLKTWCLLSLFAMSAGLMAQTTPLHAVHFSSGSDAFTPTAQAALQQVLWQLKPGQRLMLSGRTDAEGSEALNTALSLRRTQVVQAYCQSQGLHVEVAEHHGESAPVASNQTDAGRAANRRVEVHLLAKSSNTPNNSGEDAVTLEAFLDGLRPAVQTFRIVPERDTVLICNGGSMIYVPQGAFKGAFDGMLVKLEVTEALKKSDMVLAALHTQSGSKMLESAGMMELRAYQGKKELQLKDNKEVQLFLPSDGDLENMQVFYADEHMDWEVDSAQQVRLFSATNLRSQLSYQVPRLTTVRCRFFSCRLPRLWTSERSDRQTIPRRERRYKVIRSQETRFMNVTNQELAEVYGVGTIEQMDEAMKQEERAGQTLFAAFSADRLGWINCDRFLEPWEERTEVLCQSDDPRLTYNYLVFEDINSVMTTAGLKGQARFQGIPIGKSSKLVSMRVLDGEPQLCLMDLTFEPNHEETLTYTPVSQAELFSTLQDYLDQ